MYASFVTLMQATWPPVMVESQGGTYCSGVLVAGSQERRAVPSSDELRVAYPYLKVLLNSIPPVLEYTSEVFFRRLPESLFDAFCTFCHRARRFYGKRRVSLRARRSPSTTLLCLKWSNGTTTSKSCSTTRSWLETTGASTGSTTMEQAIRTATRISDLRATRRQRRSHGDQRHRLKSGLPTLTNSGLAYEKNKLVQLLIQALCLIDLAFLRPSLIAAIVIGDSALVVHWVKSALNSKLISKSLAVHCKLEESQKGH
jgi:hypothetical protein